MVTGMCPFVSQTEYLIFQKIQALDYTFPEGFDMRVKDLVSRLLVINPEKRLGTLETRTGYPSIKNHKFFEGVDFFFLLSATWRRCSSHSVEDGLYLIGPVGRFCLRF